MTPPKLPPPSFDVLVQVLAAPCIVHLGLAPNPATGQKAVDREQARWTIDLLHVLEEKTRGSISGAEKAQLDAILHQLRQAYAALKG